MHRFRRTENAGTELVIHAFLGSRGPPLQLIPDALGLALTDLACLALTDLTVCGQGFEDAIKTKFPGAEKGGGAF